MTQSETQTIIEKIKANQRAGIKRELPSARIEVDHADIKAEQKETLSARIAAFSKPNYPIDTVQALSTKVGEKLLNICTADLSEVLVATLEVGANTSEVESPCSSTEEEKISNVSTHSDPPPADEDPRFDDPNFYEIKLDLFDNYINGTVKNTTQYRANVYIRAEPSVSEKYANKFKLDFYKTNSEYNRAIKNLDAADDEWYIAFDEAFDDLANQLLNWTIKPRRALLSELTTIAGSGVTSEFVGYAGAFMYQVSSHDPVIVFYYGGLYKEQVLDFTFNRSSDPRNKIWKKGICRDAERQHLDIDLQKSPSKFKIKTRKDFLK